MKNSLCNHDLKREIGFFSAVILVVANMIGTGIFTTSGFIMEELGNPQTMLLCWFVGGIFALCGALCYGELGAMFPHAGGEYVFLRESFGKCMGFLSGWISLIVGFSAPIAAASIAFATYFFRFFSLPLDPSMTFSILGVNIISISPLCIVAIGIIIIFSLIHFHSLRVGSRVQNVLTLFKLVVIFVFIVSGLLWGHGSTSHFSEALDLSENEKKKLKIVRAPSNNLSENTIKNNTVNGKPLVYLDSACMALKPRQVIDAMCLTDGYKVFSHEAYTHYLKMKNGKHIVTGTEYVELNKIKGYIEENGNIIVAIRPWPSDITPDTYDYLNMTMIRIDDESTSIDIYKK